LSHVVADHHTSIGEDGEASHGLILHLGNNFVDIAEFIDACIIKIFVLFIRSRLEGAASVHERFHTFMVEIDEFYQLVVIIQLLKVVFEDLLV
jgi:hypothetical protein